MMHQWNTGTMEWWRRGNGVAEYWNVGRHVGRPPIIPLFHHSIIPSFHHYAPERRAPIEPR